MTVFKKIFRFLTKRPVRIFSILLLLFIGGTLLWSNFSKSTQAHQPLYPKAEFVGAYRIGQGAWQVYEKGVHIPACQGPVTLRGQFLLIAPDGTVLGYAEEGTTLAFYLNHISLFCQSPDGSVHTMDNEDRRFGASACGKTLTGYTLKQSGTMELVIRNPHRFGNETAVDDLLDQLSTWPGIDFERDVMAMGNAQRSIGTLLFVFSIVLLGIALFSTMLHLQSDGLIWRMGLITLFAGAYFIFSAEGAFFRDITVGLHTTALCLSIMLYLLFFCGLAVRILQKTKAIGLITVTVLGAAVGLACLISSFTKILFYDLLPLWALLQTLGNLAILGCLIYESVFRRGAERWLLIAASLPLLTFQIDLFATAKGFWQGGLLSKYVFLLLFLMALLVVWQYIPQSINARNKAKELEVQRSLLEAENSAIASQLQESRVAIMLSQIQPHFIYNTLGTIERMCLKDPHKAFELVRNFSLYLRGNFSELESTTPIPFQEEMKHVEHYVNIERVRFPDMEIRYALEATEFVLPALSVQPLVENAIKHGLMALESGGSVHIHSYETPTHYCITVQDDGAGFDPTVPPEDAKKHVGLRNIQGRLQAMVKGTLTVQSAPGQGTKATIQIPKEEGL